MDIWAKYLKSSFIKCFCMVVGNVIKVVLLQLLLSNLWKIHGKIHLQAGISQMTLVEHHGKESHATAQGWLHCEWMVIFCSLLVLITIYSCDLILRGLSTMGLKGKLSGDIGGLTELRSLWVFFEPTIEFTTELHCYISNSHSNLLPSHF